VDDPLPANPGFFLAVPSPENSADPEPISLNVFFSTLDPENSKRTVESGGLTPVASADPPIVENDPEPISVAGVKDCVEDPENVDHPDPISTNLF
jgi:hypothetical protein